MALRSSFKKLLDWSIADDTTLVSYGHGGSQDPDEEKVKGSSLLKVLGVNCNIKSNTSEHRTDWYETTQEQQEEDGTITTPQLVVRRGQPFDITLQFDRGFSEQNDDIRLIFDAGDSPKESRGTRVMMILSDEDHPKKWGAKTVQTEGKSITVRIFTPPDCYVAKWMFKLDAISKKAGSDEEDLVYRYTHPHPIYILFNPWCFDDTVYLDDEQLRTEYVLRDYGRLYQETETGRICSTPWNFGQFEDFMLDCCMYLLDKSKLDWRKRGNAVNISRKISALTNSQDDDGVLVGNWTDDFEGGTNPSVWVGSVRIMEQYWKTKSPVSYGQCWVFSGVVTTICRCLGIPARSITNYQSAHDSDANIAIENHYDTDGEPLEDYNGDSVWNFHVWNEVWMARPDLPTGFGGWQVIDATPQETSDGVHCAGPASVEAVKRGRVELPFDGPFIFSEVNADRVNWTRERSGRWRTTLGDTNTIGMDISTLSPNSRSRRLDVTDLYKYPEGSQEERAAVLQASKVCGVLPEIYDEGIKDMSFSLTPKGEASFGEDFEVMVEARNEGSHQREVYIALTVRSVYYTGVPAHLIKKETCTVSVATNSAQDVTMRVTYKDYADKMVSKCGIKVSLMAYVEATKQVYCKPHVFHLRKPEITIQAPEQVRVGQEYDVDMRFQNPLPKVLDHCEFVIEGAGLQKGSMVIATDSVGHKGEAKATARLKARRPGTRHLSVCFYSDELSDVRGETSIKVSA